MALAWVGLGSNLDTAAGNRCEHVQTAFTEIGALPKSRCLQTSRLYRSAPIGPQDQLDFCNAVAQIQTKLSAHDLLRELLNIEILHARKRERHWGPRSLDLDLLLYGDQGEQRINTADLQLPHPRLHQRAFVLKPLADLDPDLNIPGHGVVSDLLDQVSNQLISLWNRP